MHELSIANSILNIVLDEIKEKKLPEVKAIGLKIGALSGILADSLEFGFDALKLDTPLQKAKLEIEEVPICGKCENCSESFEVKDLIFTCPSCQSPSIKMEKGQELDIAYLEIDEEREHVNG
ncbi:MAG: hydrogenase maturation nickel metallochaperone HypA [Calditrichaeota bacterium]|nr:MAG: hydrogenase maturation nickel metallochaperone HypA [Calditrichota bacterium]MBL1206871.1 hydrogenase maturation nickel metallochaperone HypA [Calditrichota bacterium]NOG46698.1 hydrogenase maturation nickel metallochaperone HypA [Calditrichota bacterium]